MFSPFIMALNSLADESKPVSEAALRHLSGPSREEIRLFHERFPTLSAARRREIITRLVDMAEENALLDYVDLLRGCLGDPDAIVRRQAIEGLWECLHHDLIAPLLRILASDPDSAVRAAAATSLGRYIYLGECDELDERRVQPIRDLLLKIANDPQEDIEVARRAIESLAYINTDEIRRLIDRAYTHGDPRMRESALFAMGRSADRFWSETVLGDLHDPSPAIRYEAARATGELHLRRAVSRLIELADDTDREVQEMAIWALGQIGGKRARQALEAWAEGNDEVKAEAASAALEEIEFSDFSFDMFLFDPQDARMVEVSLEPSDEEDEEDEDNLDAEDDLDEGDPEEWPDEFLDLL